MRVTNNTVSETLIRQIQQLGSKQAKLQNQVATGQRIFQPEDDPSSMGRVLGIESEQRQITQYISNADRATELHQASYAALQQIKKVSDRATEIGTLGAGAIGAEAAGAYATEIDQLIEQTLQLTNTKFRNDHLFAGTAVDSPPFVETRTDGKITAVDYAGNDESASIVLSENASIAAGTSGETNLGLRDFLRNLLDLRQALEDNDSGAVADAQADLIDTEDTLVSAMAEQGGIQTRIEANRSQLESRADNLQVLMSAEADADLPETIVRLTQTQTAYQAALQSSANIMKMSLLDYIS